MLMEVIKEQNYLRGALDQVNERFSSLDARIVSYSFRGKSNDFARRAHDFA